MSCSEQPTLEPKPRHASETPSPSQSDEYVLRRSRSVNVPLTRKDAYRRLQPLQLTAGGNVDSLSPDNANVNITVDITAADAADDNDEDTRDAG